MKPRPLPETLSLPELVAAPLPVNAPPPFSSRETRQSTNPAPSPSAVSITDAERTTIIIVVIAIILLAILILVWRVYWFYRYRSQQRRQRDDAALLAAARRAAAARAAAEQSAAAEARAEQALETFDAASVATDSMCAVCLERLDVSTGDVLAAPCMHVLHAHCWRGWLAKDPSRACPICRASVLAEDQDDDEVEVDMDIDVDSIHTVDAYQGRTGNTNVSGGSEGAISNANTTSVPDDQSQEATHSQVESRTPVLPHTDEQAVITGGVSGQTGGIGSIEDIPADGTQTPTPSVIGSAHAISEASPNPSVSAPSVSHRPPLSAPSILPKSMARIYPFSEDNLFSNPRHLSLLSERTRRGGGANFEVGEDCNIDSSIDPALSYTVDARGRRRQLSLMPVTSGPMTNSTRDVTVRRRLVSASAALNRLGTDGRSTASRESSVANASAGRTRPEGSADAEQRAEPVGERGDSDERGSAAGADENEESGRTAAATSADSRVSNRLEW